MSYLTLAYVRQTLWRQAMWPAQVAYATASAADKLVADGHVNEVLERFIQSGNWKGTIVRARFAVSDGEITLPNALETVLGANPIKDDVKYASIPIRMGWHDLISNWCACSESDADGCLYSCVSANLTDLGDTFATFVDPAYASFYIKAKADLDETSKTILLRGLDANGALIYQSDGTEGVSLAVDNTNAQTTQAFSFFGYWVKNAATNGIVRLWAVDTTDASAETLIAIIVPSKTVSGYRRYRINTDADQVEVIAKRACTPVVSDNDAVIPSNLGAIKRGLQALKYEEAADDDRARQCWAEATALLELEREAYDGSAQVNPIRFTGMQTAGSVLNLM